MYEIAGILLALAVLSGIRLMSTPVTAVRGNLLAAASLLAAILLILWRDSILTAPIILVSIAIGSALGLVLAVHVTMLQMPQLVALLNGLGGAASLLTAFVAVVGVGEAPDFAGCVTGGLAVAVGGVTLSGSLVAAAKLHGLLPQKPMRRWAGNRLVAATLVILLFVPAFLGNGHIQSEMIVWMTFVALLALVFGIVLALPVGGADMPITISLLNSMSGLAASICGFVVEDAFLVATGAIVGAAGLILTQVMCGAMNRSLVQVLAGAGQTAATHEAPSSITAETNDALRTEANISLNKPRTFDPAEALLEAKTVIIIPGYGMALGEAETLVRDLYELLDQQDKDVKFAIHPVAGRMPGHMTVLLADVDIPYDKMVQIDAANPEFAHTDVAIIVGACDVVNPAATYAEGTPIYGMPILRAHEAKRVIVCNFDAKPGYSGVENSLYGRDNVVLLLGNAASTLENLLDELNQRLASQ